MNDPIFKAAFHNSPAMQSVVRAADHILVEVNDTFLNKLGFARDEVLGKTPFDLNFWVNPEMLIDVRQELEANGFMQSREVRLRDRHGNILTALLSVHRVDLNGEPHFVSAGVDITRRKQTEARLVESERRLRESEARFSKAFQASPLIMSVAKLPDARLFEVNEAFVRFIGLPRDQIIGRTLEELGLWARSEERQRFDKLLGRGRLVRDLEALMQVQNGQLRNVRISAELLEINGEAHLLTFALDITEQKRAETEMQQALEKERELNQLKSDFVSLVSHEFRTPLEVIMSSADNLDRYHDRLLPEKREQLLRTINKSVRRMSGMMDEVLVLGRLESDRMTFKPAAFELRAFCQRMCDEIEAATAKRCPIQLEINNSPEQAFGDENVLRHIFTNLLSNAVKYSPPDQHIVLRARRLGQDVIFEIQDHGCGIPEADQKRLFQAFHRGSNVRQIPGTGLGLLIVQRCVELHGGEIQFQSIEGQGTTFTLKLPLFP